MKTLGLLAALLVAQSALGMNGGAPQNAASAKLANLFGQHDAFTATAEVVTGGEVMKGVEYAFRDGKLRTEVNLAKMAGGQASEMAGMGMDRMVTLVLPEKNSVYLIYPGMKAYVEIPRRAKKSDKEPQIVRTVLGEEKVEGHPCKKEKVIVTEDNGDTTEILAWVAQDMKVFPIRTQVQAEGQMVTTTFRDVKFNKPDAALFELPAGYQRYGSMQEMMMGSMQRMMGGE